MRFCKRSLTVSVAAASLAGCAGGVDRTLVVESDPPGALVYLNDQEVGRTPAETPFLWYGTYDLALRQEGYQTVKVKPRVWAPWWQIPPLDLLAELVPIPLEDRRRLAYTMKPLPEVSADRLIERAEQMRTRLESSDVRPTTQKSKK